MRRILIALLMSFLVAFSLSSLSLGGSVNYSLCVPEQSNVVIATGFVEQPIGDFSLGAYLGLGYSARHYRIGSSNALVYGPAVALGLEAAYDFGEFNLFLDGGAKAIYSQFPTVLWYSADICFGFPLRDRLSLSASAGVLFWEDSLSFDIGLGMRFGR